MSAPRWSRPLVALLLLALALVAALTAARFTVFAPVDEKQHYAYVQSMAEDQRIPRLDDFVSPETQAIATRDWPRPTTAPAELADVSGRQYEAFQPPLYYAIAAPAFLIVDDHRDKLFALRFFDALLLLGAAGVLWLLARTLAPENALLAFAGGLIVLLWPGVVVRAVTASPTALELIVAPALLLVAWRVATVPAGAGPRLARRWLIALGVLTGLALLTRSTLVYLLPVAAVAFWRARADLRGLAVAALLPLLMVGPWLAMNHDRYDALTASSAAREQQRAAVAPESSYEFTDVARYTRRFLDNVLATEQAGQLDVWWVRIAVTLLLLALVAVCVTRDRRVLFFAAPVVVGWLMMVGIMLRADWPSFNLRYLYPVLPALAVAACSRLDARAWRGLAACAVLLGALWVDMAGAFYFTDLGDRLGI